ncbi:MAG: DNA recombination protein RmuC [Bacteroidaceae bacterium]|nr:DNA recombination protein RmuC [Bacteroidaceae bacterium]MBR1467937.1 DNA recombination protein RmuC [Bacteroidaceae bacterium]
MSVIVFVIATVAVAAMFVAGYVLGRRSMGDQREEMRLQMNLISEQLKTTSENVLKTRQQELGESNRQQVSQIIDPLQRSLAEMSRALEDNRLQQRDALTRLDATIQANMKQSSALGERADRLTRALTGEVKIQGTFGELKLRQLLEDMELREGEQYDTQETLRDSSGRAVKSEDGSSLIPDYILHFPQNRHVVVDCKMSLTAYERYVNSDTQEERTMHLQEHLRSVRQQVKVLARKDYTRYLPKGYNKLNFAIMYLPIEGALNLALENDSGLWNEAYREGVMILGPQTMYMNLRVLEMMWTQIRQLENQEQMMKAANTIVERVQDFSKRFDDVEHSMQDTMRKMDSLRITTADSGPGIITAARALIKAGAQENRRKKPLEDKTLEQD